MSTTTTEISATVDSYIAAWNEADPSERRRLIGRALSDDVSYIDPMLAGDGLDGVDATIASAQEKMPNHQVRRVGAVDSHHDRVRFGWEIVGPAGEPVLAGIDVGIVGPDGRLRSLTGFFDPAPE